MPPQAGIAVYVRGQNGKLAAARIYDDVDPPPRLNHVAVADLDHAATVPGVVSLADCWSAAPPAAGGTTTSQGASRNGAFLLNGRCWSRERRGVSGWRP